MTLIYTALQTTATGIGEIIALLAVILFIFLILIKTCAVPQANVYVIERLGTYEYWQAGIHEDTLYRPHRAQISLKSALTSNHKLLLQR